MSAEIQPIDDEQTRSDIQQHRLSRIRQRLELDDCAAIVLFDPVNIRYATGSRNMQVWTMHNVCRYTVIFANADTVMFELGSSAHLAHDCCDDIRPSLSTDFLAVGHRGEAIPGDTLFT